VHVPCILYLLSQLADPLQQMLALLLSIPGAEGHPALAVSVPNAALSKSLGCDLKKRVNIISAYHQAPEKLCKVMSVYSEESWSSLMAVPRLFHLF